VKHIADVSRQRPAPANTFQDIVCDVNDVLSSVLDAKGSSLVLVTLISDKCEIPPIDGGETNT